MFHRESVKRIAFWQTLILISLFLAVTLLFFNINLTEEKTQLSNLAKSQASLIESMAQFDQIYSQDYPEGAVAATLGQVVAAQIHFESLGDAGEFTMAEISGDKVKYLYRPRLADGTAHLTVPLGNILAVPMSRALEGESGTVIARDYDGDWVVAAYEPVAYLDWGLVAKQDLSTVILPHLTAFIIVSLGTFLLIRLSSRRLLSTTEPVFEELAETNQRYVHALHKTETAIFGQDAEMRYTYLYHPYLEDDSQVLGKTDDQIFQEDEARVLKDIKQNVINSKTTIREIVQMTFGPDTHMMDLIVEPILNKDGHVLGLFGSATNVTSLVESNLNVEFQAKMLQSAGEAIVYSNLENQIEYWNAGAERQYGVTAEEAIGQDISIILAPSEQNSTAQRMQSALEEDSWRGRIQHTTQAGRIFWADVSVFLVRDANENPIGFIGINRDIDQSVQDEEDLKRSIARLQALHKIDRSITGSTDLHLMLDILIEEVHTNLEVDAVTILFEDEYGYLKVGATAGFDSEDSKLLKNMVLKQGLAIDALRGHQTLELQNTETGSGGGQFSEFPIEEIFSSYFAYPLIARGESLGVLEIFNRTPLQPNENWREFLATLAEQSAIALHSSRVVEKLRQTKRELEVAYAATLEGWARALEFRDAETAGHSQRVTEMTLRLAVALGVHANELIHISRGALLHDIGKMGIPDNILNKAGPLDDDEWEIMRTHPLLANQMLSRISFLLPALEIPMWHHERWDGSGYPHGLKGKEIPLPARIFAVVDVWDALCSDRPYRPAWDEARVLEHIKQEAGKHFDPFIVTAFLELEPEYK